VIPFPHIGPTLIRIGPLQIRWYGLMYLIGFFSSYVLMPRQRRAEELGIRGGVLQDLIFYLAVGLISGARLGYVLFYQYANLWEYLHRPLEIIAVWHGGMSFHGGLIGSIIAGMIFARRRGISFWDLGDMVIVTAPVGLFFGRLGNFINGELYGRVTSVPWGMVFPDGGPSPRHPSQLYEALLEGVLLFIVLWALRNRPRRPGSLLCLFMGGYGLMRFVVEFFREPDAHIGLLLGVMSMGQVLCTLMVLFALLLWVFLKQKKTRD